MQIVLVEPEIPQNTGSVARLCAATGTPLHLVGRLGFSLEDRYLKRAGLDYWPLVDLVVHPGWESAVRFFAELDPTPLAERLRLFTARGGTSLFETDFGASDLLCFGSETRGLPAELLASHPDRRVYVPIRAGVRSLNLANVVCLASYTALRSAGLALPDNDGTHVPMARGPRAEPPARPSQIARRP